MARTAEIDLRDPHAAVAAPEDPCWSVEDQAWLVSRYRDVQAILRDQSVRSVGPAGHLERIDRRTGTNHPHLAAVLAGAPLFQNGEQHRAGRDLVRAMMAATMRRFTLPQLREVAGGLVEQAPTGPVPDALPILADPLPNMIAADMLGLSEDSLRWLRRCGREVFNVWRFVPPRRDYDRLERICAEVRAVLAATPLGSGGDPARASAGVLASGVAGVLFFLATAAVETTASTIAASLDLLSHDPAMQEKLRQTPHLIGAFTDEILRLAGPIRRLAPRMTSAPIAVGETSIPADRMVILHIERAERDPAVHPGADRIDLGRRGPPLLAFGGGSHICVGLALGRTQVCVMLECILRHLRLAPGSEPAVLTGDPNLRQYAALPLTLTRLTRTG